MTRTIRTLALFTATVLSFHGAALAQDKPAGYPTRPIRLIIAVAPGAGADAVARMAAQTLTEAWGQTAVVDSSLELGTVSELIEVRADAAAVNLVTGAVSGLVGEREIRDLPLNGRSFQQLALLQPGVQAALAAGYVKFPDLNGDCVAQPGQGGMGIHYLNASLLDAELDPLRPELLVYRKTQQGRHELVALEYVVPAPVWDALHPQPPVLFGHPFHLLRTRSVAIASSALFLATAALFSITVFVPLFLQTTTGASPSAHRLVTRGLERFHRLGGAE